MKKLALVFTLLLFSAAAVLFITHLLLFKTPTPAQAQTCQGGDGVCPEGCTPESDSDCSPTVEYYKTDYETLKTHLVDSNRIQVTAGKTILAEHGNSDIVENDVFAGHLGSFWTPPFFSAGDPVETGFHMGLGFYDRDSGNHRWEWPSDPSTEAFWYPSKMVVTKTYPGGNKDHQITGTKVAIPGYRAFGLKLEVENVGSIPSHMNTLFYVSIPAVKRLTESGYGWVWYKKDCQRFSCSNSGEAEKYNNLFILFNQEEKLCMGLGIDRPVGSWRIVDGNPSSRSALLDDFTINGQLINADQDSSSEGTIIGISYEAPETNPDESYTIPFVAVIEQSTGLVDCRSKLQSSYSYIIDHDIERMADEYWNNKLEQMYSKLPHLEINNELLKKIYHNSFLHLPLNKLQADDLITGNLGYDSYYSLASFFGKSMGEFPWADARRGYTLALTDPGGLKEQIIKYLNLESSSPESCRAYNPVSGNHLCDHYYTFNYWSLGQMIYDYVTVTGDYASLGQEIDGKTVLEHFEGIVERADSGRGLNGEIPGGPQQLVDFGNDYNLYEFNIHCDMGGEYTGFVPTPNGERYISHKQIAELYKKLGQASKAAEHEQKAEEVKSSLNTLWNEDEGWFDCISIYDHEGNLRQPYLDCNKDLTQSGECSELKEKYFSEGGLRNTFWPVGILHLINFDDLLDEGQKDQLVANLKSKFLGSKGLTSLPIGSHWCGRPDWHGPGIYVGEASEILTGLFGSGEEDIAYDILNRYSYLADAPYWSEDLAWNSEEIPGYEGTYGSTAYMDSLGWTQVLIKGMFGIRPKPNGIQITPAIPSELISEPVSLSNLHIGDKVYAVEVDPSLTLASITSTEPYEYQISLPNNKKIVVIDGRICQDDDDICPEGCTPENDNDCVIEGDLDGDQDVDSQDLKILLENWGASSEVPAADLNEDEKVNGIDFGEMGW